MLILKYTRRPSIIQFQILDYITTPIKTIYNMSDPKEYRRGKKALDPQKPSLKRGRKKNRLYGKATTLFDHLIRNTNREMSVDYLLRFPRYLRAPSLEGKQYLHAVDAILYWEVQNFNGFFDDLFLLEDLTFWDKWENQLERSEGLGSIPSLHDMFIYECLRIHLGIEHYTQFWRILSMFSLSTIFPLLNNHHFIPVEQDFCDFYHKTPLDVFEEFFYSLIAQIVERKLISYRILLWDCQFTHSNSSDYKSSKSQFYTDKDAGIGRHNNKFLGVGYMVSTLYAYCGDVIVPIFCMHFPANTNDKKIFFETFEYFFSRVSEPVKVVLADRGAYSLKNLRLLAKHGIIGMLASTKNVKTHNIVKLKKDLLINRDFVPVSWTDDDLRRLYALRTSIERQFSHNTLVYNARRVNIRGIAETAKHRYMILCLDLLKTLACHKLGRGDLFQHSIAFSQLRSGHNSQMLHMTFRDCGFNLLGPETHPFSRQNQNQDRFNQKGRRL